MKTRILFVVLISLIGVAAIYGQKSNKKINITGTVFDGTQTPVANAIIMVDGEKTNCLTDSRGFYKIRVKPENTKIGIFTLTNGIREEVINGRKTINFQFEGTVPVQKATTSPGDETVDIGYGVSKKKNLTSSVGEIDGTKSKYASYATIYDMLRGEIPGVVVSGTTVYIRNPSSINASNEPLFVVDGVPVMTIDDIQPQMVKSINVLKGSDASIYGVRGANGVILIDLKKGKDR